MRAAIGLRPAAQRTQQMLQNEIGQYGKSNSEIEVVQFQIASTILMLMLQFIEGSLQGMQEVLHHQKESKVA